MLATLILVDAVLFCLGCTYVFVFVVHSSFSSLLRFVEYVLKIFLLGYVFVVWLLLVFAGAPAVLVVLVWLHSNHASFSFSRIFHLCCGFVLQKSLTEIEMPFAI